MSSGPSPGDLDRLLSERAWLRRLAGALTRDDAEAEELTQEVYVAAMARAPVGIRRPRACYSEATPTLTQGAEKPRSSMPNGPPASNTALAVPCKVDSQAPSPN